MLGFWIGIGLALLGVLLGNTLLLVFGIIALAMFFLLSRESRQVIVQPVPAGAPQKKGYRVLHVAPVEDEFPLETTMEGPLPGVLRQLPLMFMSGKDPIFAREMMGIPAKGEKFPQYFKGMDPFRELLLTQRKEFTKELEEMKEKGEKELKEMARKGRSGKEIDKAKDELGKRVESAKNDMVAGMWKKAGGNVMWRRDALPFPNYGFTSPLEKIFIGFPFNLGSALLRGSYTKEQLAPGKETIAFKQLKKILFEEEIKLKKPDEGD